MTCEAALAAFAEKKASEEHALAGLCSAQEQRLHAMYGDVLLPDNCDPEGLGHLDDELVAAMEKHFDRLCGYNWSLESSLWVRWDPHKCERRVREGSFCTRTTCRG